MIIGQDRDISYLKVDTTRFQVVEHRPWRRVLLVIGGVAIVACCLVLGYFTGYQSIRFDQQTLLEKSAALLTAEQQVERLRAQFADANLSAQVQGEAVSALRKDMTELHDQISRLREEVTFYKSLMAPGSIAQGLQISELDIRKSASGEAFDFELLLTQVALRRQYISGELRLDLIGRRSTTEGQTSDALVEAVLPLTEVSDVATYPLKFRFRYFQGLRGRITLPADFVPVRITVTAQQNGEAPLQESFSWPTGGR